MVRQIRIGSDMTLLEKGKYRARLAGPGDVERVQALRAAAFSLRQARDEDQFDSLCDHVLIERLDTQELVGTYRTLSVAPNEVETCYSAQFYDLSLLSGFGGTMLEVGRFCVSPALRDPDILRLAWGALTRMVDAGGHELLFGCTSFKGTDPAQYAAAFGYLQAKHLAPNRWKPGRKAAQIVRLNHGGTTTLRTVSDALPALLRTYLAMGGWVSDHAVVDQEMNTLHVFTAVEVGKIPETRRRLLRAVAR